MTCLIKNDRMLFQYRVATSFVSLWDGFFEGIEETSSCSLYEFFDLNSATGVWLDYLGLIFNQGRDLTTFGDIMTWDLDNWDDGEKWDGNKAPIDDITFKALIWARILRNNTKATVNDMIGVLTTALNIDNVIIVQGVKHLDITIDFTDGQSLEIFNALSQINPTWFGVPAGVSFTITKVL